MSHRRPALGDLLFELLIDAGPPVETGGPAGELRRCIPLLGGTVSGRYSGTIVPGGADWQATRPDGTLEIDARYVLQLEEGSVEARSMGLRVGSPDVLERLKAGEILPADAYYFRTSMRFCTAAPALAHLNQLLAIALGERLPRQVRLLVHPVI